jgi:hypothetical protein
VARTPSPPGWLELRDEERVVLRVAPSKNLVLASLTAGVVLMMAMAVVVGFVLSRTPARRVSFVVLLVIVAMIAGAFLVTERREYVLTSRRVCAAVGFGSKRVEACSVEAVADVSIEQDGWEQLLSVGTVRFATRDGEGVAFGLIENPAGVHGRVLQFVDLSGDG